MKTKKCTKCNNELPLDMFNRNGNYTRGDCKKCQAYQGRMRRENKNPNIPKHKAVSEIVYRGDCICLIDVSTPKFPNALMRVDKEMVDVFACHVWSASERNGTVYARSTIDGKSTLAHRLVRPEFKMIDHIDNNGLNNTRDNLRETNHTLNGRNRKPSLTNGSAINGVCWNRFKSKWQVTIGVDNHIVRLGCYDDLETAIDARKQAESEYWCEAKRKD